MMDSDSKRHEEGERHPPRLICTGAQAAGEECHSEVAECDAEEHKAGTAGAAGEQRLELEGLRERFDAEESRGRRSSP